MNTTELLNILTGPIIAEYNQSSSYPVSSIAGIGLNIVNLDASNSLVVTVTHDDATTTAITIPSSSNWSDFLKPFKSFTKSGSSATFLIQLKGIRQ